MILGITGGTGSGKTTLLELAQEQGFRVLDCDAIYHQLLEQDENLLAAIDNRFPGVVENGVLQRNKLGAVVFADPQALEDLNRITHGAVYAQVQKELAGADRVAIDAIALFESGLDELCHVTVAVTAPMEHRIKRLMARDGISEDYARSRIAAQKDDCWYESHCRYLLVNEGTPQSFRRKCLAFLAQLGIMEEKPKEVYHDQ